MLTDIDKETNIEQIGANNPHTPTLELIKGLYNLPFNDLVFKARLIHIENFNPNSVQLSTLVNIKSGACPEDCSYCPQSIRYKTDVSTTALMSVEDILDKAKQAKQSGASRFCMGAAWRSPKTKDFKQLLPVLKGIKELGLETCMTLGMLTPSQACELKEAGLDYYNHNLDTSENFYSKIISTRTFDQRLDTIKNVQKSGMKVCCGGILGLGESECDRFELLHVLANMEPQPESVPINTLVKVKGTPLYDEKDVDPIDLVKLIATARIVMPKTYIRLSAGRSEMSDELQALCFFSGANSIFYGEELLTTENPEINKDKLLMAKLGLTSE
jgi:biotin synthase